MTTNYKSKMAHINVRMAQLKARMQDLQAREQKANRSKDTRQCILAGRCLFETAKRDPEFARRASSELMRFLSRDADRKVMEERLDELKKLADATTHSPPTPIPQPAPPPLRTLGPEALAQAGGELGGTRKGV